MGATDFGISPIRTPAVYYHPARFSEYKIIHYESKNPEIFKDLQEFDDQYRSDYIIGIGIPLDYRKSEYPTGCYEWYMAGCAKVDGTELLQYALTTGTRLLVDEKYRTFEIEEYQKKILIEFCGKYGLNDLDELCKVRAKNGDPPPHDFGCNVWSYIRGLEELSIQLRRMEQLLDCSQQFKWAHVKESGNNGIPPLPNVHCEAKLTEVCLYSVKEKKLKSFMYADSLLDVASYQLSKVMSDGALIRKCANPACPQVIIGGRSDKKTCSNACRKALERYQKKHH